MDNLETIDKKVFKELTLSNVDLFMSYYFGENLLPFKPFHIELLEAATDPRIQRLLVLFPCNHGKSQLVSQLLPIYLLCQNPNNRIIIIANNTDDANRLQLQILRELESNEKLLEDYGTFKPPNNSSIKWGATSLSINQRVKWDKDDNVESFGTQSHFLGHRADIVIADDIINPENSATPEQRKKLKALWEEEITKTVELKTGKIIVVGTVQNPFDLYTDLMTSWVDFEEGMEQEQHVVATKGDAKVIIYRALSADYNPETALWPERLPFDKLLREKTEHGTIAFEKRFMNLVYPTDMLLFKPEWVDGCKDKRRYLGERTQCEDSWDIYIGVDPAIGKSYHSKFFAIMVIGIDPKEPNKRYLLDIVRDKIDSRLQAKAIVRITNKWKTNGRQEVMIESNAFQQKLEEELRSLAPHLKINPHITGKQKRDPFIGVERLSPLVENKALIIPWGRVTNELQVFYEELIKYPLARTSDMLMAWWFIELRLKSQAEEMFSFHRKVKGLTLPTRILRNPFYE